MTVKVLIDAMLPWRLANLFREHGHEARHVRRLKDFGRTDAQIWRTASENAEIVVTCDKDFKVIQANGQSVKLLFYRHDNLNRARILADFAVHMKEIEAFAMGDTTRLEIP